MNLKDVLTIPTIYLVIVFGILTFSCLQIDNSYADATCPENTYRIVGKGCFYSDTENSIIFTSYDGYQLSKTKLNTDKVKQETIITKRDYEILNELLIIKPEINKVEDMTGKALAQKIQYDKPIPTVLTRNNYYFGECIRYSLKNAESTFYDVVYRKEIQNPDFGKNNQKKIEYSIRDDNELILKNLMNQEKNRAKKIFFETWGNFTNY